MKYGIFYFSGTGNTKLLAQTLAKELEVPAHSIEENIDWAEFFATSERLIVLYPVYFSVPPMLLRDFINEHATEIAGKEFISIASQMCYSGDGARVIEDYLPEGCRLIDIRQVDMPNNIPNIPIFPLGPKSGNRRKTRRALHKIRRIAASIRAGQFSRRHSSALAIKMGEVQRNGGLKHEREKRKSVWVSDACIRCNRCVRVCPAHNFVLGEHKAVPQGECTLCLRCENQCPTRAITVIMNRQLKRQYPGPVVK